jgi:hypothetical protein
MKLHNKPGKGKTLTYSLEVLRKSRQLYSWFFGAEHIKHHTLFWIFTTPELGTSS